MARTRPHNATPARTPAASTHAEATGSRSGPVQERAVQTRERILQAAIEVIQTDGAANLTLDRVALKAGVSKGGFLYHFGSKDALMAGLLDETLAVLDDELDDREARFRDNDPGARGTFALAYLDYVREPYKAADDTSASILAAAALDDELLANTRATFERWQERLLRDDGLAETTGLLARIVGDGLWLIDLFGLAPPTKAERHEVLDLVSAMISADGGSDAGGVAPDRP
ncbi:TetR/AcrR family transcriptional regulator [Candidatus Poriferisodalis sp.]|uniref:TetR/AcrR family transcriptional regulator n=1 Tax=Candidatus Poriferisodalis sp. TaxID=3101277 RepID=UPI003B019F67